MLESLAIRTPVIAAENGRRPEGVVTFRFNDAQDLCAKLNYVVENYALVKHNTRVPQADNNVGRAADFVLNAAGPVPLQRKVSHAS